MKNRLVAIVYLVCFLSLPVTWILLGAGSDPGRVVYAMNRVEARRAPALAENQPWNPFMRSAYDEAVTLWMAAATLCESTPGCEHVQIEGDHLRNKTVTRAAIVAYSATWKELKRNTAFESVRYSGEAMERASAFIHAAGAK